MNFNVVGCVSSRPELRSLAQWLLNIAILYITPISQKHRLCAVLNCTGKRTAGKDAGHLPFLSLVEISLWLIHDLKVIA